MSRFQKESIESSLRPVGLVMLVAMVALFWLNSTDQLNPANTDLYARLALIFCAVYYFWLKQLSDEVEELRYLVQELMNDR